METLVEIAIGVTNDAAGGEEIEWTNVAVSSVNESVMEDAAPGPAADVTMVGLIVAVTVRLLIAMAVELWSARIPVAVE